MTEKALKSCSWRGFGGGVIQRERKADNQRRKGSIWKRYIKAGMSWDSQLREAAVVSIRLTARAEHKKHLHWGGGCGTIGRILVLSPVEEKQGNSHFWVC